MALDARNGSAFNSLLFAVGGGGDAITADAVARRIESAGRPGLVMSYSWDRLILDPVPGPRLRTEFRGLQALAPDVWEVLPSTDLAPPAKSSLPRLAADLRSRLLLADPSAGAIGIAKQVSAAADLFDVDQILLVDVGGDILGEGRDQGYGSPLADTLAVAGCLLTDRPCHLVVVGPGVDGELSQELVLERLTRAGAAKLFTFSKSDYHPIRRVFEWHPSEASGLVHAAAKGVRGRVEVRDAGRVVPLTVASATAFVVPARALADSEIILKMMPTSNFDAAISVVELIAGSSETAYEQSKAGAAPSRRPYVPGLSDLARVDEVAAEAMARGVDFITVRRLAEMLGVRNIGGLTSLRRLLAAERPELYDPPLYAVRP